LVRVPDSARDLFLQDSKDIIAHFLTFFLIAAVPLYVAEKAPSDVRGIWYYQRFKTDINVRIGVLTSLFQASIAAGTLLSYIIGYFFIQEKRSNTYITTSLWTSDSVPWRACLAMGSVLGVLLCVCTYKLPKEMRTTQHSGHHRSIGCFRVLELIKNQLISTFVLMCYSGWVAKRFRMRRV